MEIENLSREREDIKRCGIVRTEKYNR